MSEDCWIYTTRCACCDGFLDYTVAKRTEPGSGEGFTYEGFSSIVRMHESPGFRDCETCGRMTLQTIVAFEHAPESQAR